MKKLIAIMIVLMLLSTVTAFATPETAAGLEATVPGGKVVESFDAMEEVPGSGTKNLIEYEMTDGAIHVSLLDGTVAGDYFQVTLANEHFFSEGVDGFACYIKNLGENDLYFYFRFDYYLNGNKTAGNAFLNVIEEETYILYPIDGGDPIYDSGEGESWNGAVMIPTGFEGYLQVKFDVGYIKEGGGEFEYDSIDGLRNIVFFTFDGEEGDNWILDDFACVKGSDTPVVPTAEPTAEPTATPVPATEAPTATPVPATEAPTVTPVPATEAPTATPVPATDAPTEAPTAQNGNLTWLYILIGVVIVAAIVVAVLLGKKKK
ncbi:MAG: hypothetical protein KIG36_06695 [Eubacteriales bacterium]|nr:hypothetical protein [Eubacteriales bacterium]